MNIKNHKQLSQDSITHMKLKDYVQYKKSQNA